MPEQRIADARSKASFSEEHVDCEVLHFMLGSDGGWPWSIGEIASELGDESNAIDALRRLDHAGLVHRFGDFAFPTRTARRAAALQVGCL